MTKITDNAMAQRFELTEQGHTAYADYALDDRTLTIKYVFASPELRGQGTAGRLMEGIAAHARARGFKIIPLCGYAALWLQRRENPVL